LRVFLAAVDVVVVVVVAAVYVVVAVVVVVVVVVISLDHRRPLWNFSRRDQTYSESSSFQIINVEISREKKDIKNKHFFDKEREREWEKQVTLYFCNGIAYYWWAKHKLCAFGKKDIV